MQVKIKVPDEWAGYASARGITLEAFVQEMLTTSSTDRGSNAPAGRSPSEIGAWLESLAEFSDKIPPLPETISREWIYQDHD